MFKFIAHAYKSMAQMLVDIFEDFPPTGPWDLIQHIFAIILVIGWMIIPPFAIVSLVWNIIYFFIK